MALQYTKFANGLPVLTVPMAGTQSATALVLARVGSRYEAKAEQGLSHFLEHMLFKGTAKWPTAQALSQELDGIGAEYNAYTSKEYTGYYVKAAARHLPLALEVLADMVWRPKLDGEEMTREKKVICEEIKMYEENPLLHIGDLFEQALYNGSTLGVNIAGSQKSVTALTRSQLTGFWQAHYTPKNMLLVVAGKVDAAARRQMSQMFAGVKTKATPHTFRKFHPAYRAPQVAIQFKETEQTQLALGFPAYGWGDKRLLPLELLAIILGGNMSSRLFLRLREREGLCYSVRASTDAYFGTGSFTVQAGLDRARLPLAIKLTREELAKVRDSAVPAAELNKAKEYIRGKFTLALEDSSSRAEYSAKHYLAEGSRETPEQHLKKLSAVTARQVQAVARDVLKSSRATMALIGPFRKAGEWRRLLTA